MKRDNRGFGLAALLLVLLLTAMLTLFAMRSLRSPGTGSRTTVSSSQAVEQARQAVEALNQHTQTVAEE